MNRKTWMTLLLAATLVFGLSPNRTLGNEIFRQQAASESDLVFRDAHPGGLAGTSVAPAGDVNGDGIPDIIIGAPGANAAFIVLGRPFERKIIDLAQVAPQQFPLEDSTTEPEHGIIAIICDMSGDRFGWSVSSAGDFNGDGLDDVIIGWPGASPRAPGAGAAVVVLGQRTWSVEATVPTIFVGQLSGGEGLIIHGEMENDFAGACVAGGGDFNNDDLDDVVIAAPGALTMAQKRDGAFYIVYGTTPIPAAIELGALGTRGAVIDCPEFGALDLNTSSTVCAWPGDVNSDGIDDLLLGTPRYEMIGYPNVGAAWVIFGRPAPPRRFRLEDIPTSVPGVRIYSDPGTIAEGHIGFAVAGVGDVNGDFKNDFAVSVPDGNFEHSGGMVAIIFGGPTLPPAVNLTDLTDGYWIIDDLAPQFDRFGASVASAGDPNNDGVPDIVVGAPGSTPLSGTKWPAGHAYVVYMREEQTSSVLLGETHFRAVDLVGVFGTRLVHDRPDLFGWSVCSPGDLNGDTVSDIAVGCPFLRPTFDATFTVGHVFCFFFEPPRIVAAYLDDPNGNNLADPGEHINVVLNKRVIVDGGPADDLFYLARTGWLGPDSTIDQWRPGSNRFQIIIGDLASGIVVPGLETGIDFNALGPRNRVVSLAQGVNPIDTGEVDVNDTAIDLRLPITSASKLIRAASGGSVEVPTNADSQYGGHKIEFAPGALAADATVTLGPVPDPPGDFGLGSAVWLTVTQSFSSAHLTIRYSEDDIPPGFTEEQMRIVQFIEVQPGVFALALVPGPQLVDTVNNTISVVLSSFPPQAVPGAPTPNAQGGSGAFAGLPIETVDERTATMAPSQPAAPALAPVKIGLEPSPGKQSVVTLTPGPFSIYTKHQLVFHDFTTSTPGSISVTIRSATVAERTAVNPVIGSRYFPDHSDAVFTIETTDAQGSPIAFTWPVDITVEFKLAGNPHGVSDVMDFDENPGHWSQMRIVRSVQNPVTYVPNFVFIGGEQHVDPSVAAVSINGFTNLTDSQGKATYGAVVDTSTAGVRRWHLYR